MLGVQRDWKEFWQVYPVREQNLNLFQEVGKTPITEQQFQYLLDDIFTLLMPEKQDVVLDLCCGNGLITNHVAKKVQQVVGIDYSLPLIQRANQIKELQHVEYRVHDARNISGLQDLYGDTFTKIYCNDALGYFNAKEVSDMLDDLLLLAKPGCRILLGNVLDKKNLASVYNTSGKKLEYQMLRLAGNKFGLGTWWNMDDIRQMAEKKGLECSIHNQNELLHTASHRKDILLTAPGG